MKLLLTAFAVLLYCIVAPAQIIHKVAGTVGVGGYSGNGGPATAAVIQNPESVALDTFGNLYIADGDNDVIQKVDVAGIITTIAGSGGRGYSGDGGQATNAVLNSPTGLSLDIYGNIYFADLGNHVVRMISTAGIIKTFAGNGTAGYTGDGGAATNAKMHYPDATAIDNVGNIYICDLEISIVRKVTSMGVITTIAGNGLIGYSGDDGPATDAELSAPNSIATDAVGNLFIADSRNNVIRKVDTFGIITTIAGSSIGGYSGDGGPATAAEFSSPWSVCINNQGMYVADLNNNVIRKIDTSGTISTVAGTGIRGYTGNGGLAIYAELTYPGGMAVDRYGNFYFGDLNNFVVRMVDTSHTKEGIEIVNDKNAVNISPNPASKTLNISCKLAIVSAVIINMAGEIVFSVPAATFSKQLSINIEDLLPGVYFAKVNGIIISRFIKQ